MRFHFKNRELNIPWEYFAVPFLIILAALIVITYRMDKGREELIAVSASVAPAAPEASQNSETAADSRMFYDEPDPDDNPADAGTANKNAQAGQNGEVSAASKVNINKAGMDDLIALPYIGEIKAKAVIEYRNANGPFKSVDDLLNVKGIGPKTLEKLRPFITVE